MTIEYSDSDQDYSITMEGASTQNKTQAIVLTLKGTNFSKPLLSGPVDGSDKQSTYPAYTWSAESKMMMQNLIWKFQLIPILV
jgi:hypothetical protein